MSFKRGQLEYFVTVAEEGQMTRAARRLHIAQPALSQAISQLEGELGIELLQRHARGVSLTAAGEIFLAKARVARAANIDAAATAQSLARAATGSLEVGYIGPPPTVSSPLLFASFAGAHPDVDVSYCELPFPSGPTAAWLADVDVALAHVPEADKQVGHQLVRSEPRAAVVPEGHRLAGREQLHVADLLEETFIGYHDSVQAEWAGFHTLDDVRGAPACALTTDRALNPAEMLLMLASRRAVGVYPAADARVLQEILRGVVAVPIEDAEPFSISLSWRKDNHNPLVLALTAEAANLGPEELRTHAPPTQREFARAVDGLNGKVGERRRPSEAPSGRMPGG
ncbi:MAG TPA: LysR family transcriptional regulator [Solirubrobacteraceae bacterium]|nr:LysR family transcriptional regulator [Solirubrobacteraceae bacterium]